MARTPLQLEDDAAEVPKADVAHHCQTVKRAAERPLVTEDRSGFHVVRLNRRSPTVTAALVDRLREDLP